MEAHLHWLWPGATGVANHTRFGRDPVVSADGGAGAARITVGPDPSRFDAACRPAVREWAGRRGLVVAPGKDVLPGGRVVGQTVARVRRDGAGTAVPVLGAAQPL